MKCSTYRSAWLMGVFFTAVGCGAPSAEEPDAEGGSQAVSGSATLAGVYGEGDQETLEVVVAAGRVDAVVQGRLRAYASSNGVVDQTTACQLSFSGVLGAGQNAVQLDVADVRGESQGELRLDGGKVTLVLHDPSPACENAYFRAGDLREGITLARRGALPSSVIGYRTVQSDRAYFYDASSGGTRRNAYIVKGDTVEVGSRGEERMNATFSPLGGGRRTTGFLGEEDFVPLPRGVEQLLGLIQP